MTDRGHTPMQEFRKILAGPGPSIVIAMTAEEMADYLSKVESAHEDSRSSRWDPLLLGQRLAAAPTA